MMSTPRSDSPTATGGMDDFWGDDFAPLQAAGKAVLAALREDEEAPDADLYRRILSSGPGSHLYYAPVEPSASSSSATGSTASPGSRAKVPPTATLKHLRSIPLPPYLKGELQKTHVHSMMGLLPEADLAWMTVDHKIFLWSYDSAPVGSTAGGIENFCTFAIPSGGLVVSVGLVRPKKGVFKDVVEWCLVVTTREEAILCALARSDVADEDSNTNGFAHGKGAFRLIPTQYIVPTDSVAILSIRGTPDGRIFLGGHDGSLYEMDYEGFVDKTHEKKASLQLELDAFYDGDDGCTRVDRNGHSSVVDKIVSGSKRALSSVVSPAGGSDVTNRPHKCRKLNHSSHVSSIVRGVVPDFLVKASSSILGAGKNSTAGGPIVQLLLDEERSCIYSLSSRGWICVFDLCPQTNSSEVKLMAVLDTPKTARSYLEAVSRGRMYPPSVSGANITFAGGGASAQAGVGGMEGARSILKLADSEVQRERNSANAGKEGVLTPASIHVIPRRESGRLTLLVVTYGGLRYYLSSLSSSVMNAGPGQQVAARSKADPLAPSTKFTLCHVRAPPPVGENGVIQDLPSFDSASNDGIGGFTPKLIASGRKIAKVDASYYGNGVSLLALKSIGEQRGGSNSSSSASSLAGTTSPLTNFDVVVATTPDSVWRKKETSSSTPASQVLLSAPGGISEMLHKPMTTLSDSLDEFGQKLPGGRVWAIASSVEPVTASLMLTLSSQTPSDSELGVGLVPSYFPPSRVGSRPGQASKALDSSQGSSLNVVESSNQSNALVLASATSFSTFNLRMVLTNFMLSRPLHYGLTSQRLSAAQGAAGSRGQPSFRISARYGHGGLSDRGRTTDTSVTVSRSPRDSSRSTSKAARLSPWLLRPAVVPLDPISVQHVTPSRRIVALNAGGLHYFQHSTILANLTDAILSSGANIGHDENITNFFKSYGYKQGCAMCLSLAVGCGPAVATGSHGEDLKRKALQAALNRGLVPRLVTAGGSTSTNMTLSSTQISDSAVPQGYEFRPSALVAGLTSLFSRLLRPIWYKPAVVVTEGRSITSKVGATVTTPARVKLLLDDLMLEEIRRPLYAMQSLMKNSFSPAVNVVPGTQRHDSDVMDVELETESGGYDLLTRAMQHQGFVRSQGNGASGAQATLTSPEMDTIARLIEERNLHSLYRLLSRTIQLLNLLSLLKRAQLLTDLPEVEWGLVHGLTVSQLVQTRNGQERIENLLNSLVTSTANAASGAVVTPSADSDRLANLFASKCYLYFSPGSRLAYLGFRSAIAALSCPSPSARRVALRSQASEFLKRAARYWYSPQLITGRMLHTQDMKSYDQMALRAMQFDSPVAKAAEALAQLEEVVGLVDVCLETASNFGGRRVSKIPDDPSVPDDAKSPDMLWWEQGLYHRRRIEPRQSSSTGTPASTSAVGADVTPKDAIRTCHAIIFHHLSTLLNSPNIQLAESMVSACAASSDTEFLHSLYEHLLNTNHMVTLLKINSIEVEKWLKSHVGDPSMLWRYYTVQRKNVQAGEVMWMQARDTDKKASLEERIEFLTKARTSFQSALAQDGPSGMRWERPTSSNEPHREELRGLGTKVCETLEVALLQDRILNTVTGSSMREKLTDDQYSRLSSTLVPVSDLYNEFAAPLSLYDLCLLILHSCHHNEASTIETLWRSIICEEIVPCKTRNPVAYKFLQNLMADSMVDERIDLIAQEDEGDGGTPLFENGDWMNSLIGRVSSLGKEVYGKGADFAFPVETIATILEGLRRVSPSSRSWPLGILVDVGVPYFVTLDAYESMANKADKEHMGGIDFQRRECIIYPA